MVGADGNIYVFGGVDDNDNATNAAYVYSPTADAWSSLPSMPTARYYLGGAMGNDGNITRSADSTITVWHLAQSKIITPTQVTGRRQPPAHAGRGLATVQLPDGRIAAIGGYGDTSGTLDAVELYNALTKKWTAGPSLPTPTSNFAAAVGTDGSVYAIGGLSNLDTTTAVEVLSVIVRSTASVTSTVTIAEAPIAVPKKQPRNSAFQGLTSGNIVVATFVDQAGPMPAASYAASLVGDGTTSSGVVSVTGANIMVSGTHTFAVGGLENRK